MKTRGIMMTTIFFIALMLWTAQVVYNALTGSSLFEIRKLITSTANDIVPKQQEILPIDKCSINEKLDLKDTEEPHIQALNKYQELCNSLAVNKLMIFIDMPKDATVAKESAKRTAATLRIFSEKGIEPIVIVEPVSEWGLIDFVEFRSGFYDSWITTFFAELKSEGVTDTMMGTWVPFPEANLPLWNHNYATPDDFSFVVNKYLRLMKAKFPTAKGSILLNSATYETDDFNWSNGEYVSLLPYVKGLDPKLIDSIGLQGFPWTTSKIDEPSSVFNADEFLSSNLIAEAADVVSTKNIWLNTGTFGAKYTIDPETTVKIDSQKRKDILNGILSEAIKLKNRNYNVTVNIFAEDKSESSEATDWSYLPDSFSEDKNAFPVFSEFSAKAESFNISISLFDKISD